jgi:hypothetical protein
VLKKISAENQSKKITLFFDVAKRPPFPQPPGLLGYTQENPNKK